MYWSAHGPWWPAPTTLASGQNNPHGVAIDAANIYWTANYTGTVVKVPIGGGTPTTLASGQNNPARIAVDATSVYWTNYGDGTVMKLSGREQDLVRRVGGIGVRSAPDGRGAGRLRRCHHPRTRA
ncbi:MAG: hypothetical protein WBP56_01705 [Polyangia bacterium]